jgi:hypothetical protein
MALTGIVRRVIPGSQKVVIMSATYTGTSETFDTGLDNVTFARAHFTAGDQTTSVYRNAATTTEGGTPGSVHITGISATDGVAYLIASGT